LPEAPAGDQPVPEQEADENLNVVNQGGIGGFE